MQIDLVDRRINFYVSISNRKLINNELIERMKPKFSSHPFVIRPKENWQPSGSDNCWGMRLTNVTLTLCNDEFYEHCLYPSDLFSKHLILIKSFSIIYVLNGSM